ncbi:MAG: AsmA family protein [Elusimicrobia bacterium]|nr:AsmA family protein [Elusimicrobiota bacterium]
MQSMNAAKRALRLLLAAFRTVLRGFGMGFIVLVLLVAGLALYAHHRFGPEEARALAVDQLQALLRREVSIERMVLTPRGLKIKGLRVRRDHAAEGDLLVCDTALLTVKLEPLLRRRLEFDTLRLESPQIALTREADGTWDFADIFTSTRAGGGALPLALAAAETIVIDGVLRVDDRKLGRKISFEKLSLRAEAFDQDHSFPLSVSFVNSVSVASRTVVTSLKAEGSVDLAGLRWSSASARADRFSAQADGLAISGKAAVTGFSRPVVELEASVAPLGPDRWARWAGRDIPLSLPATRWMARAALSAPRYLDVESLSVETPAGIVLARGTFDLTTDTPTLKAVVSTRDAVLEKSAPWHPAWAAHAPAGKVTLRASIEGRPGALQVKDAEVALRAFGMEWSQRRFENVDMDAAASDEFASLKASVTKGRVIAFGNSFEELAVAMTVIKQTLTVDRLALRWSGANLRLRGRVDRLSAPKEVLISGTLDRLVWEDAQKLVSGIAAAISTRAAVSSSEADARPWVRTFKYRIPRSFPDTVGHLRVGEVRQENFWCRDLDLMWSLKGVSPALDKVGGEARVRFGPGRVADIPAVQDSHRLLRVLFLPFVYMHKMNKFSVFSTATAYPKTLDFNRIESEYALDKGVAATRYFHVDSEQLVAFAEGKADFGDEHVDMNVLTRLTHYDGVLPEWWVDEAGRPAIGFRVKGDLNKPELEPRFKKIPVDEIERKLEEGRVGGKKRFEAIEKLQTL